MPNNPLTNYDPVILFTNDIVPIYEYFTGPIMVLSYFPMGAECGST